MSKLTKKELGKLAYLAMFFGIREQGYFRKLATGSMGKFGKPSPIDSSTMDREMVSLVNDVDKKLGKILATKARASGLPSGLTMSNISWARACFDPGYRRAKVKGSGPVSEQYAKLINQEFNAAEAAMDSIVKSKGLKHV